MPAQGDRVKFRGREYLFDGRQWVGYSDPWTPVIVTTSEMAACLAAERIYQ